MNTEINLTTIETQLSAQRSGLEWLWLQLINYRPKIYEEVWKAYKRRFKVRGICFAVCLPIPLIISMFFFCSFLTDVNHSQTVYGHVDGNEIWYIQGEKKILDRNTVGYTGTDSEVIIYLDENNKCESVVSRKVVEKQQEIDLAGIIIPQIIGAGLLVFASLYCEKKYCWQFQMFWKWYDRFIPNRNLDIEEFISMYEAELQRRSQ